MSGRPPKLSKKIRIKVSYPFLGRIPKLHWSALEWLITLSLAAIQLPEKQLDKFAKMECFQEMLQKKSHFVEESKCFRSKWLINMLKKPFSFLQNVFFTNETTVRISSDGIVKSFSKKWNEIS